MIKEIQPKITSNLISELEKLSTNLEILSVYDIDSHSTSELIYKIAYKVNEVIKEITRFESVVSDNVNEQNEQIYDLLNGDLIKGINQQLEKWLNDGTFQNLVNNKIFNELNNKLDNLLNMEVNIISYGAIGDKINDDTMAIKSAIKNGRYITCNPSKHYIITDIIEVPKYVTLDFKNAHITLMGANACFKMNAYSKILNARIHINSNIKLQNSVIYIRGDEIIDVGWDEVIDIRNISIEQEGSITSNGYKENIGLWLDCRQTNINSRSVISGILVDNLKGVKLKHLIYNCVSGITGSTEKSYITSNTFNNLSGYNCKCFIKDEIIGSVNGGNGVDQMVSLGANNYNNLHFQPEDNLETQYIDLCGDGNNIISAYFWDNSRPSNQENQIVLRGNFNYIQGAVMPPYPSIYWSNLGQYNTIIGKTYGIPTHYEGGQFIAERNLHRKWGGNNYNITRFNLYKSVATKKAGSITNNEDTPIIDLNINWSDLPVGTNIIDLNAMGTGLSTNKENRRIWIKINNNFKCGGSHPDNTYCTEWECDGKIVIRKYLEGYADIRIKLKSIYSGYILNKHTSYRLYNNEVTEIINIQLVIGSDVENEMICNYAESNMMIE